MNFDVVYNRMKSLKDHVDGEEAQSTIDAVLIIMDEWRDDWVLTASLLKQGIKLSSFTKTDNARH